MPQIRHECREQNKTTDLLARKGRMLKEFRFEEWPVPPVFVLDSLEADKGGASFGFNPTIICNTNGRLSPILNSVCNATSNVVDPDASLSGLTRGNCSDGKYPSLPTQRLRVRVTMETKWMAALMEGLPCVSGFCWCSNDNPPLVPGVGMPEHKDLEAVSLIVSLGSIHKPSIVSERDESSSSEVMGKDSKSKDSGSKGKGKQAAGGSEDGASKGKGKAGKGDGLGTCTYVKARHVLCEKQSKINEAYKILQEGWLNNGDKVPPAEFAKVAAAYSECPSGKKGGDLGWFPRGKMAGPFQEVAFNTPVGATSAPFKSTFCAPWLFHRILAISYQNMDTISFYLKGGRTEISEHLDRHGMVAVVAEK
ncbi:hypothetical protein KY285_010547 [Solanum tuberosum]|nr:hypothetical protein KY285_010547 [Solanum tuberosum]